MKIALIIQCFLPKWIGGAEIATYKVAQYLSLRGHEVHVVTSSDTHLSSESCSEGFYIHRVKRHTICVIGAILFWWRIVRALKKIKPERVHAQGIEMGIPAYVYGIFAKKRYIVYARGSEVYYQCPFKKPLYRLILKKAGAVIALTEDMKHALQKIYNRHIYVIPNGTDCRGSQDCISADDIRRDLGVKNNEKVIIFIGRFNRIKGVKYVIQAVAILLQQTTIPVRLLLVGDGPDEHDLKKTSEALQMRDVITFVGSVIHEKISCYLSMADIFVLPSLSEGFPCVVLEAMAFGLPVIATHVGGMSEIIADGENGFLVEPQNPHIIAEKMRVLLTDRELRESISINNRQKAEIHSWENVVNKLEEVYASGTCAS